MTALEVVQRHFDAYNARDLQAFTSCFSESVQVFRPPSIEAAISGKAQLAEFYGTQRFNLPALKAELLSRIVLGNKVIDHERIWGLNEQPLEAVGVYAVVDGLIQHVWFYSPE